MTSRRRALGYIRMAVSGRQVAYDDRAVVHYAHAAGFELTRVLIVPENVADPLGRLIATADADCVDVVIAPNLDHVDSDRRAITEQCELRVVDTDTTWPREHRRPLTTQGGEL